MAATKVSELIIIMITNFVVNQISMKYLGFDTVTLMKNCSSVQMPNDVNLCFQSLFNVASYQNNRTTHIRATRVEHATI